MEIACIYDTNTPYTTGVYFHRAFQELGFEVDAFAHKDVATIPNEYQLYFIVDSGEQYKIPQWTSGPALYYAIDVHLDFDARLEMAKGAQLPVMAQLSCGAQRATNLGFPILWVPLACDPWIHQDYQVERDLDIAFIGHLYNDDGWRTSIKSKLIAKGHKEEKLFIGEATKEDIGHIYSRAKIVLNNTVRDNKKDINMRVFEAMSCGAYLIMQKLENDDMDKIIPKELYSTYTNEEEMHKIINEVLSNWDKYSKIAQQGKLFIRAHHTYASHLKTLMNNIIGGQK